MQKRLVDLNEEEMTALAVKNWMSQHPNERIENLKWNKLLSKRGLLLQLWQNPKDFHFTLTRIWEDQETLELKFYPVVIFLSDLQTLVDCKNEIFGKYFEFRGGKNEL